MDMWFDWILIFVLTICVITDIKSRKIYNKVVFPATLIAFLSHLFIGGWRGFYGSALGFLVGFALLLVPYLFGGMGAGDVKLLALIGALKGSIFVLYTSLYMGILGGILAILIVLFGKPRLANLKVLFFYFHQLKHRIKTPFPFNQKSVSAGYPYGVAIAGGAVLNLLFQGSVVLW